MASFDDHLTYPAIRYTLTRNGYENVKAGLKQRRAKDVRGDKAIMVFSGRTPIATTPSATATRSTASAPFHAP